jgi:hypothetical protein
MRPFGLAGIWIGLIGCIAVVSLIAVSYFVPLHTQTTYRCYQCGAWGTQAKTLFIQDPFKVTEGKLSDYWRKNVDPQHQHTWAAVASGYSRLYGAGMCADHVDGFRPRWTLDDKRMIAVLEGLPTPAEREAFVEWLWQSGRGRNAKVVSDVAMKLRAAYYQNSKRTDWPDIMRRLGCYPGAESKSP